MDARRDVLDCACDVVEGLPMNMFNVAIRLFLSSAFICVVSFTFGCLHYGMKMSKGQEPATTFFDRITAWAGIIAVVSLIAMIWTFHK